MRIITGMYRGRVLRTVNNLSVRPATGRVRQTVFDMLAHRMVLDGARVLDLFAGSGSLGIECLSRGAAHATFVEDDEEAVQYIEENVRMLDCEERTEILSLDAMAYLRVRRTAYDLIFADPPYAFTGTRAIPEIVFEGGFLAPDGYLVIEHAADLHFQDTGPAAVVAEKRFGRTIVTFFRHHRPEQKAQTP
jgi:16S rRNA (guanine966-N2)-methyltransferase